MVFSCRHDDRPFDLVSGTRVFQHGQELLFYGDTYYHSSMSSEVAASGARGRTRRALVDAAIGVWARDPAGSLGEIAGAARVGRTTLHRYFPDRSALATAVGSEVVVRVRAAADRARVDQGSAAEVLRRLCREYFELADVLALIFNGAQVVDVETWTEAAGSDTPGDQTALRPIVESGHRDGSIRPDVTPEWAESVVWALLYAAWDFSRSGNVARQDVITMLTTSVDGALGPRR
jgi:TetR/AcrR family transcriptional repressor of lfrA